MMNLAFCCLLAASQHRYASEDNQSEFLGSVAAPQSLFSCYFLITFLFLLYLGVSNWNIKTKGNATFYVVSCFCQSCLDLCCSLISGSAGLAPPLGDKLKPIKHQVPHTYLASKGERRNPTSKPLIPAQDFISISAVILNCTILSKKNKAIKTKSSNFKVKGL